MEFFTVATVDEIPPGKHAALMVADRPVAVFNVEGTFYAVENVCPHMASPLAPGEVRDGAVACPWHGWTFDLRTGAHTADPACRLLLYTVRVVGKEIRIGIPLRTPKGGGKG